MKISISQNVCIEMSPEKAKELRNELLFTGSEDVLNELRLQLEAKFPRAHYKVIRLVDCSLIDQKCDYLYTRDFQQKRCEKCSHYRKWKAEIEAQT